MGLDNYKHIRFIGAGGIGMSALINLLNEKRQLGLLEEDFKFSKSDKAWENSTAEGPHNDPLSDDIDLAVVSTAIPESDHELSELKKRGTEIWHRSQMLLALSEADGQRSIVITGTHGKTSCSAMVSHILTHTGKDPSFAVGGVLKNYQTNGKAGKGEFFVLEGDESDRSFLRTNPYIGFITNVEADHLENYPGGLDEIKECFSRFINMADKAVLNIDDPVLHDIYHALIASDERATLQDRIFTYSAKDQSANFYLDLESKMIYANLDEGDAYRYGPIELKSFGAYNYMNALGSIASCSLAGVSVDKAIEAMKHFDGIARRLEYIGEHKTASGAEVTVFDDYAHHPTEIKALLNAVIDEANRQKRRFVFVYQPHHPRRTQDFWDDFVEVFKTIPQETIEVNGKQVQHEALIADIYVARSGNIEGISSDRMVKEVGLPNVRYLKFDDARFDANFDKDKDILERIIAQIETELQDGDILFCVGAGNITKIAAEFGKPSRYNQQLEKTSL